MFVTRTFAQSSIFYVYDPSAGKLVNTNETLIGMNKEDSEILYIDQVSRKVVYSPEWLDMYLYYIQYGIYGYELSVNAYNPGEDREDSIVVEDTKTNTRYTHSVIQKGCKYSAESTFDFSIGGPYWSCVGKRNDFEIALKPGVQCDWYHKAFVELDLENFSRYEYRLLASDDDNASITLEEEGRYIIAAQPYIRCKEEDQVFDTLLLDERLHPLVISSGPPDVSAIVESIDEGKFKVSGYTFERIDWYINELLVSDITPPTVETPRMGLPVFSIPVDSVISAETMSAASVEVVVYNGCDSITLIKDLVTKAFSEKKDLAGDIVIAPNPNRGKFKIIGAGYGTSRLYILNSLSEIVYEGLVEHGHEFDSRLPAGVYYVHVGDRVNKLIINY